MAKRKGGGDHGGGGGHDGSGGMRWLLTYADMITLLLALFIFLYSISEINAAKLNAFTTSFAELFGIGKVPESGESSSGGSGILPEANAIVQLQQQLESNLADLIEEGMAEVEEQEEGLKLRLKDKVLFSLGQAEVTSSAGPVLLKIAKLLNAMPNPIRIEGHTDNLPMARGSKYPSNWELSGARAASVVRYLVDHCGVKPARLTFAGYAEYRPLGPNIPLVGNPENRRVEIVVLKKLNASAPEGHAEAAASTTEPASKTPQHEAPAQPQRPDSIDTDL